ncbi:tetratricopeptide repeat protein [Tahibacter sp.]|uniref:tetratricopeptide repeat protein n=1 Tax=Tahibacter sp. TaxID=2056211 RepID=UPI0028C3C905|nr:tetratricopeptide repeat protein [Tahibacter sp.]
MLPPNSTPRPRMPSVARFHWCACALLGLALAGSGSRDAQAQPLRGPQDRCAEVVASGPIPYRGTTLLETADIKTPEIRRINALISARCYDEAAAAISDYQSKAPQDYQIEFVVNRLIWLTQGAEAAQEAVTGSLATHPDFASVKVLQASLYLEQERYDDARGLLDDIAKAIPNDLWLMIDRMKIELHDGPKPDMAARLKDMLKNAQFPPSARELAGRSLERLTGSESEIRKSIYRDMLTFESATPFSMKAVNLARELVIRSNNPDESIAFLEPTMADPRAAARKEELNQLLAVAYLQKAATINAAPTSGSAALIARSVGLVEPLTMYRALAHVPNGLKLRALIIDRIDPKQLPRGI